MNPLKLKIKMDRYGEHGWEFDIIHQDGYTESYRTNEKGNGLWKWERTGGVWQNSDGTTEAVYEWKQQLGGGTGQFSLSSERKAAYSHIRRHFIETPDDV